MKIKHLFLVILASFLFSCTKDDEPGDPFIPIKYTGGFWILNEGNFGTPNGTIGFYSLDSNVYIPDIYGLENGGVPTGDVLQSMNKVNSSLAIVANNDNKVLWLDASNGEALPSWGSSSLNSPRYMTTSLGTGKFYVSNWGPFDQNFSLVQSFVLKFSVDGTLEKKILTDKGSEGLFIHNDHLYVANSFSNTVEIIDLELDSVVSSILVGASPQSFALSSIDENLWVISTGTFGGNDGSIAEINLSSRSIENTYNLGLNPGKHLVGEAHGDSTSVFWFYSGKDVYSLQKGGTPQLVIQAAAPNGIYGLGWNSDIKRILVSDHNNYAGNGRVFIYTTAGSKESEFEAGILPNNFN